MKITHFKDAIKWWDKREEILIDNFYKAREYSLKEIVENNFNLDLCGYPHEEEVILPPKELIASYHEEEKKLSKEIDDILSQIEKLLGGNI